MPIMVTSICQLPDELLASIVSFLDVDPPSSSRMDELPSLRMTEADETPLKNLSLANRRLHAIVREVLFLHFRLDLDSADKGVPSGWFADIVSRLESFVEAARIPREIRSLVVRTRTWTIDDIETPDPLAMLEPAAPVYDGYSIRWIEELLWTDLLTRLSPSRLTVIAPVYTLSRLAGQAKLITNNHSDFPKMHIQSMTLTQSGHAYPKIGSNPESVRERSATTGPRIYNVIGMLPWNQIELNEGSCLQGYNTYEWFRREPLSLLDDLVDGFYTHSNNASLTSLHYRCIFAFRNCMPNSGLGICTVFTNLTKIRLQLTPDESDRSLDDPDEVKGVEVSDVWLEVADCYIFMVHHIDLKDCALQELRTDDGHIDIVRDVLEDGFAKPTIRARGWYAITEDTWSRGNEEAMA